MHCDAFVLSYRGYTIWVATTRSAAHLSATWSAAYQLCLNNVALHQYVEAPGVHRSAKAAAAKAARTARADIDSRLDESHVTRASAMTAAMERVSSSWLLRLAESRHRKG